MQYVEREKGQLLSLCHKSATILRDCPASPSRNLNSPSPRANPSLRMFSFGLTDLQAAKKAPPPTPLIAMDEDAQKRNTDCIYFLASPLTCKKGKNCEYRHSEAARTNPRDCWFWKSGNCLNAHCSFRHLPLEGKPGSASVVSMPTASTMPQSVSATSTVVAAVPSKSKTPCYFFSQGCCAKNEKCPFLHGLAVASSSSTPATAPTEQNSVGGVNGKAGHASGRPVIVLKQSTVTSEEVQTPVNNGKLEVLNETHLVSSGAPMSVQGVPQSSNGLKKAMKPERVANFVPSRIDEDSRKSRVQADRVHDFPDQANKSRQSKASKNIVQDQVNCQGLSQIGHFGNRSGSQSKALQKDGSAGGGSCASPPGSQEGEYSLLSNSHKSSVGLRNSPVQDSDGKYGECKGHKVGTEGDLRNHLAKRMKANSSLHSSMGKGGYPGLATQRHGDTRLSNDLSKQKQQQRGNGRNSVVEADVNGIKVAQFTKRESFDVPNEATKQSFKKVQSRSFASSCSSLTSKSSTSENVKETIAFAGPKSLAQIKAEKMARAVPVSNATERFDSSTMISECGSKLGTRKLAVPAESRDAAASNDKLVTSCVGVSTIKKDDVLKLETANFELEGCMSTLLKRKRESESGCEVKGTLPRLTEAQVSIREMEDGEFCKDDSYSNVDDLNDTCTLVSSQEDFVVASPSNAKEEVSEGLQRLSGEAAEFEMEFSEDGSKFDMEMEENTYGGEDYEMDDDDDDDFAEKLGRFFGLSNE